MTVDELIEKLKTMPGSWPVRKAYWNHNGERWDDLLPHVETLKVYADGSGVARDVEGDPTVVL